MSLMSTKVSFLLLLCLWLVSGNHQFTVESRALSSKEDLELDNELKLINKPSIKSIWTIHGEKYECVDFYKQRAFDHPALKNHNFHPKMRPNAYPTGITRYPSSSDDDNSFNYLWENGKGCPTGSVPVKRIVKDDLIRIKEATKAYNTDEKPFSTEEPGTHYAILHTSNTPGKKLYGAGMNTSVYNPTVFGPQYSSSQVKLSNGIESIEVGWTVTPTLYKSNRTHLYIYTSANELRCFNTYCPVFVSVRKDLPVDELLTHVSTPTGPQFDRSFIIFRELGPSGNWWLVRWEDKVAMGFWPQHVFTGMRDFATYAEWGGKVYSPKGIPSPPMGAGIDLSTDYDNFDAYCRNVSTVDGNFKIVYAEDTSIYTDVEQYKVRNDDRVRGFSHTMFFGGPGGYIS